MSRKSKISKFITSYIIFIFIVFQCSPAFSESTTWGVSGNEINIDVSAISASGVNITIGNQTISWSPGTSFTGAIGNMGSVTNYIGNNFVTKTDWSDVATSIGISIACVYVGQALGGAIGGGARGGASALSGTSNAGFWSSVATGASRGFSSALTSGLSMSTVSTALTTQAIGTTFGQIAAHEEMDASEAFIARAALGSLTAFAYGGLDNLYGSGASGVTGATVGTVLYLGAPVLGAYYVTTQVSDQEITDGEIPIEDQAISALITSTTATAGQAFVNPQTFATMDYMYQNRDTGKWSDSYTLDANGDPYFSEAANVTISDSQLNSQYPAQQTMPSESTIANTEALGMRGATVINSDGVPTVQTYAAGEFNTSQFLWNVTVEPISTGLIDGVGSYVNLAAVEAVSEYGEEHWGEHDWRTYLVSGVADYTTRGTWNGLTNALMLDINALSFSQNSEFYHSNRHTQYMRTALANFEAKQMGKLLNIDGFEALLEIENAGRYNYIREAAKLGNIDNKTLEALITLASQNAKGNLNQQSLNNITKKNKDLASVLGENANNVFSQVYNANNSYQKEFSGLVTSLTSGNIEGIDQSSNIYTAFSDALSSGNYDFDMQAWASQRGSIMEQAYASLNDQGDFNFNSDLSTTSVNSLLGRYDAHLEDLLYTPDYGFYDYSGQNAILIAATDVGRSFASSFINGAIRGSLNSLKYKYVENDWLDLYRYDSSIDQASSLYDTLSSNPGALSNIYDTLRNNPTLLSEAYRNDPSLMSDDLSAEDIDLTAEQQSAIVSAIEDGTSFDDLSSEIQNATGAEAYYNMLSYLSARGTYLEAQKYQLNIETQGYQALAAVGLNIATSTLRGIAMSAGWTQSAGPVFYSYRATLGKDPEQLALVDALNASIGTEGYLTYAPETTYVSGSDPSTLTETVRAGSSITNDNSTTTSLNNLISGYENYTLYEIQNADGTTEYALLDPGITYGTYDSARLPFVLAEDGGNATAITGAGVAAGTTFTGLQENTELTIYQAAGAAPTVVDIYSKPSLTESITTNLGQSTMQSIISGFSMGRPMSLTGTNVSSSSYMNYVSNMTSYLTSASYGYSIPAQALITGSMNAATNNLATTLSVFPSVADFLGFRYAKIARVVNTDKPFWTFINQEFARPTFNQKLFFLNDMNFSNRYQSYNAANFSDFIDEFQNNNVNYNSSF